MPLPPDEFHARSHAALDHLDTVLGDLEHDALDVELSGDVLTLAFSDGVKFIVNAHSAAGQVWLAANTSAWHFDWNTAASSGADDSEGAWVASKSGDELMATLARLVGDKLGLTLAL